MSINLTQVQVQHYSSNAEAAGFAVFLLWHYALQSSEIGCGKCASLNFCSNHPATKSTSKYQAQG